MPGDDASHQLVEVDEPDQHPAARFFAQRCEELVRSRKIDDGSGKLVKLTPRHMRRLLQARVPNLAVSEAQFYRYLNGEVAPRIDVVYEVAALFGVSPRSFLPDTTTETNSPTG